MIGTTEILVISGVVVLLFGAAALPKFAKSIGKARVEFEKGMQEAKDLKKDLKSKDEDTDKDTDKD